MVGRRAGFEGYNINCAWPIPKTYALTYVPAYACAVATTNVGTHSHSDSIAYCAAHFEYMAPHPPAEHISLAKTNAIAYKPSFPKCSVTLTYCASHGRAVSFAISTPHPPTYASPNSFANCTADQCPVDIPTDASAYSSPQSCAH